MSERSILAYFHSPEEAAGVQSKLQALRVTDTQIERVSPFPGVPDKEWMNPLTSSVSGLGGMVLDSIESNSSAGILMAADVSASGMSDGGQEAVTGRDILLTAVVNEVVYERALRIIEDAGGLV